MAFMSVICRKSKHVGSGLKTKEYSHRKDKHRESKCFQGMEFRNRCLICLFYQGTDLDCRQDIQTHTVCLRSSKYNWMSSAVGETPQTHVTISVFIMNLHIYSNYKQRSTVYCTWRCNPTTRLTQNRPEKVVCYKRRAAAADSYC